MNKHTLLHTLMWAALSALAIVVVILDVTVWRP